MSSLSDRFKENHFTERHYINVNLKAVSGFIRIIEIPSTNGWYLVDKAFDSQKEAKAFSEIIKAKYSHQGLETKIYKCSPAYIDHLIKG